MLSKNQSGVTLRKGRTFKLLLVALLFLSVFTLSFIDVTAPPAPSVVTELRCNDGSGTTAADGSGNSHSGTLTNGPTWVAGKYGQGINLDGSNDYVNLADHADYTLTPTVSYTWSAWVRNTNFNQWSTVWSQTLSSTNFFYFYAHTSSDAEAGPVTNGLSVYWYSGSNKLVLHSNNNVLTAGAWSYVTVTYNASVAQASRFTIYVNGTDVTNRTDVVSSGTIAAIDPTNIRIGSNQPFGEYLNGAVDEVRYYRRLLSVAEIQSDMIIGSTTDATAPTVSLTAPAAGNVSGTINVNANAADNIGVIGVQFLLDGNVLGAEDLSSPYSVSWTTTTATNGAHNLTARARDAAGNTTTSTVVAVNVNNSDATAPTVSLTAPAAGNVSGTINVNGNAADNIGVAGVQFLLDGNVLGAEDLSAPYSVSWATTTATNGAHSLTARARDAAGNTTTSTAVAVTVNNSDVTAPTVSLTAPAAGNVSGSVSVAANAADNIAVSGVQFLLDGVALGTEDLTAPYSISWSTATATNGAHNLTARARDAAGNTTTSTAVAVNVNNDTQAPTISVTQPTNPVSGIINVTATASDNVAVVGVQFLLDGVNLGAEDVASPYAVSWNTATTTNGSHNLTATARDAAGNTTTSAVAVVIVNNDIEGPVVTVDPPATSPVSGTITIAATASDNIAVAGVQFLLDGVNLGTEDLTAPYSVSWSTAGTTNGAHAITARARDAAGNTTTSSAVTFTVLNNNLVASYAFSENTGTVTNDNSGNGNNGVLTNGPTWSAAGKFGSAILFDGTNDLVNINDVNSLDLTNGMTLEAWVNPSNLTDYKTVLCKENGSTNLAYALSANNNTSGSANQRPNTRIRIGTSTTTVTGTSKLALNTWTHIASTFNGSVLRLYINGVQVSSTNVSGNITTTTNLLRIGGSSALAQYFTGLIDEVRIYSRALTQAEIQTDMNTPIAPDVTSPTVDITTPAAGNVSGTINVTANAADNIAVTGVQFLLNGANLGAEDVSAPYSVSWNTTTAVNGTYTLTARARDAAGNITTSSDVIVTVDNDKTAPTISITAPAAGTIAGTVDIIADAADNTGVVGVQFLLNGNNLGAEDLVAPYEFSWNTNTVTDGSYTLTAKARDAAGNVTTSAAVIVNILNHPPDIEFPTSGITAPAPGEVLGTVNVTATANDNEGVVGVQFLLNGNNLGTEDLTAPYSVSWNTTAVANGDYILTAKARDAAGNITTSAEVNVTVNNPADAQPPVVNITSPAAGNVLGTVTVAATASDNVGVTGVQFLLDGNNLGAEDLAAPYSISWNTVGLSNGSHTLTAKARDAIGNIGTTDVVVNVNNDVTPPSINVTAPPTGNVSGTVTIVATASDNIGVTGVQFLLDGNNLGTEDLTAPYSVSWNTTTLPNGPHVLTARARDAAGNTAVSTDVNVTINNDVEAPTVIVLPPSGQNVSGTISLDANATDNTGVIGVQFILDGANLGAEDLTAPYSVSWNTTTVTNGSHTVIAKARDAAGNVATSSSIIVLVSNAASPANLLTAIHFNEGTGTAAADVSGRSHNGTLSGATWTAGKYGQSANLNGTSGYVNIADHTDYTLNPAQNYTWSAWVKNTTFKEWSTVWSQTINSSNFFYFYAHTTTDPDGGPVTNGVSVYWWVNNGASKIGAHSNNNVLTAGQWSHIAVTYDASQPQNNRFTIYVNGVDVTARADVSSAGTITSIDPTSVRIGSNQPFGEYLSGAIDEVRYYNRLLTGVEVQTDMNTPLGNDNTNPTVNIPTPTNGSTVTGTINVTANAADNIAVAGVQFFLDGNNLGTEVLTAPYSTSWNTTTVANGNHTLTARARDAAGNVTTSTQVIVNVNNLPDTQLPTVSITSPAAGNVSGTVSISATASDNVGVLGVQFQLDGVNLGAEDVTAPYTISWNTIGLSNGSHTITAKARDAGGNIGTADVVVNINNDVNAPSVAITAPAAGDVDGTISVTASASDNVGVVGVQFQLDGVNLGTEDLVAPYAVSWNTTLIANGNHTLTAKARDAAGNITTSTSVIVTVNNIPDTESPTVVVTAPSAGNVSGVVTVSANANDNAGVAGVQFLLDGVNLGNEDATAPYSVSWSTGLTSNGAHTLSARARDASGNTTTSTEVNVNVFNNNPPVVSGVSAGSITAGSAVINWGTNVPANSKVNFGTTTAYGFSTMQDAALVSSHSQILNGLNPGTLYHYQVLSRDVNGTLVTSGDNTFTSANLSSSLGSLNGHSVLAEGGKILSWTPNPIDGYHTVITMAWNYMLNTVPNDPSTGKPSYYSRSYLDPNTQTVVNWPHNPAGLYAMMIESAEKYYHYSGNTAVMTVAENVALWQLDHGMTLAADNWPLVPYASGDAGSLTYAGAAYGNGNGQGDGVGYIQPDKVGELGYGWLQLYKYDGNIRFRDAAIQAANVLSSKVRVGNTTQSPWPYRVNAHTGAIREEYCSHIIAPISLLDELIKAGLGDTAAYRTARNIAWNWMMTYPMQNNAWAQYFEDVPIQPSYNSNINQYNAMMTARYLLEHPEFDANWEAHVRGLITWVETKFAQTNLTATTIKEQDPIFPYAMGSHTSRYASVNALLYEKTGDLVAKEKAFRSFNWATYMTKNNGVVIDGPNVDHQWFTDGYGDYIRHFVTGMASVPEWSPTNQTHLLRTTSVIKSIAYSTNSVTYTTYDPTSTEVVHLNFDPVSVTVDGMPLAQRSDLSQPGWTLDVATKTIKIYHVGGTQVTISTEAAPFIVRFQTENKLIAGK
jgi:hypothetical protein